MADIREGADDLRQLVQDAIDRGATSVEEVNKYIASKPLELIQKLVPPLAAPADQAANVAGATIGSVYDSIRKVNEQAGEIAKQLLGRR